jgi:hypothetical protein
LAFDLKAVEQFTVFLFAKIPLRNFSKPEQRKGDYPVER